QTSRLQVVDQRGRRAVHARSHLSVVSLDVLVAVPVSAREAVVRSAPDLNEANSALEEAPCDEAVPSELVRRLLPDPVQLFRRRGFTRDVEHFRRAELESRRELIGRNPCVEARVALPVAAVLFVQTA